MWIVNVCAALGISYATYRTLGHSSIKRSIHVVVFHGGGYAIGAAVVLRVKCQTGL
jgi:hypothetical protein